MTDTRQPDPALARALPPLLRRRIPYAAHLKMRLIKNDGQPLVFYLPFQKRLIGNTALPALHGGVVAGFMESAALMHLVLGQDKVQRLPKTIDFNIDYVRAAGPRDSFATCDVIKLGNRVALVHIRCWQRHYDRPTAWARGHYLWQALNEDSTLSGNAGL